MLLECTMESFIWYHCPLLAYERTIIKKEISEYIFKNKGKIADICKYSKTYPIHLINGS